MLQVSGDARYADVLELALYNSILSGISLDGNSFFYTNPLSASSAFPYQLRWKGGRVKYTKLSNCCPPNVVRTIAEVPEYMYSLSAKGIWLNLYGGNRLSTSLADGAAVQLLEETEKFAAHLSQLAPQALRGVIDAIHLGGEASLEVGLDYETQGFAIAFSTDDMKEGTSAFLEKRKPGFTGR
jgi:hypothetical protein